MCVLLDSFYFEYLNLKQVIGITIGVEPELFLANFTLWFKDFNSILVTLEPLALATILPHSENTGVTEFLYRLLKIILKKMNCYTKKLK